jgi:hypothetical protein
MDKENVVRVHSGVLFSHKEERSMSFAEKWVELEIICEMK